MRIRQSRPICDGVLLWNLNGNFTFTSVEADIQNEVVPSSILIHEEELSVDGLEFEQPVNNIVRSRLMLLFIAPTEDELYLG